MEFIANTDVGKKRENNEDSFFAKIYNDQIALYVVADGLGGYEGGEFASKMLVDNISNYIYANLERLPKLNDNNIKNILSVSLNLANKKIYDLEKTDEKYKGMGTTIVLLLKVNSKLFYMSVGDSRMYYISNELSKIEQITVDDTYVNELIRTNVITKEEAIDHPQKHVLTKAVGILKNITASVKILDKNEGYLLLCSDGVSNMLTSQELLDMFSKNDFNKVVDNIIKKANANGGIDNITAIAIKL